MLSAHSIEKSVIKIFNTLLNKDSTLLEFGSGEGTAYLAKKFNVVSIEHDKNFLNKYNSKYIYASLIKIKPTKEFPDVDQWYDNTKIKEGLANLQYDAILIDGPPNPHRTGIWKYKDLFDWNKLIIIDDTHRERESKLVTLLQRRYKFKYSLKVIENRKAFTILTPNYEDLKKII